MKNKYLRTWKTRYQAKRETEIIRRPQPRIARLRNVWLKPIGQVYDENLRIREDLIFEDTGFCAQCVHGTSDGMKAIYPRALYGGYIRHKWGHFITESIARMWALDFLGSANYERIVFFSDNNENTFPEGNFRQIFQLLGIEDKVEILDDEVFVEELIIPELGYEHDRYYTDCQAGVYRKITVNALMRNPSIELPVSGKLFLSRVGIPGATRNAINLENLEMYFKKNGFKIVSPERLSLIDLIHIMNRCDALATIEGTLAHNYVFVQQPEAKRLIILERHAWINEFQVSLNKMMGMETIDVDAYYLPKGASSQDSLMLFAPTPQFREFAKDLGLTDGGCFVDDNVSRRRHELRCFISRYRRYWCSGDGLCEWEEGSGQAIIEAMIESRERYDEWLHKSMPLMWYDYMSPRALARFIIKKFFR